MKEFWLEQRDTTFIDEYSLTRSDATSSTNGQPKYWANWDGTKFNFSSYSRSSLY